MHPSLRDQRDKYSRSESVDSTKIDERSVSSRRELDSTKIDERSESSAYSARSSKWTKYGLK